MTLVRDNIIYELDKNNKTATIIKCLSRKYAVFIPKEIKVDTSNNQSVKYDVKTISAAAFKNCRNLERIFFESNNKINQIEEKAFENCISLKAFIIPQGVKKISESCFQHCINLKKIKSESRIHEIEKSAFEDCIELKSVEGLKLDDLKKISECAFKNCHNLSFNKSNHCNQKNILKKAIEKCKCSLTKNYENRSYSSAEKKYKKSISKTDEHVPIEVNNLSSLEPKAFESCYNVNLTGKSLNYKNGEEFDSINSMKDRKWEYPNNKLWFYWPLAMLALLSLILPYIQAWKYNNIILFLLFSMTFFMLQFVHEIYRKHKKSYLAEPLKNLSRVLSLFFLAGTLTLFIEPDTNIFKTVSLINSDQKGYYEIKPDFATNESDVNIRSIINTETSYHLSDDESSSRTIQNLIIENNKEILIKVTNFLSDKNNIYEAELDYNNNNEKLIIKTRDPSIQVFIQYDDHQPVPIDFNEQNTVELDIKKYNYFDILTTDDIDNTETYNYFLRFDLVKTAYTANVHWLLGVALGIIACLMFIFLMRTFELLFSRLKKIQSLIEQNKVLLSILGIIMSIIFSLSSSNWLADTFDKISSMISQF